ncbi:MAG: DUF3306 domain-containing protein [Burkholderiaceae bacterium]
MSDSFFSRWSRQKSLNRELTQAREAAVPKVPVVADAALAAGQATAPLPTVAKTDTQTSVTSPQPSADMPTQADVDALAVGADVSRFLQSGVAEAVRGAALKKLFADPAYNVISEMDDYVEDYSQMVKLSATELRQLQQSKDLYLFEDPPWKVEANARDAAAKKAAEEQAAEGPATEDTAVEGAAAEQTMDAASAEPPADPTATNTDIEEPKTNL